MLLWSLKQVAEALGNVSCRTVRRLIERGQLPAMHVGRLVRVPVKAVHQYVARRTKTAHNSQCVEPVAWKGVKPCHTNVRTHKSGTRSTPTRAAEELDALLKQRTGKKRKV